MTKRTQNPVEKNKLNLPEKQRFFTFLLGAGDFLTFSSWAGLSGDNVPDTPPPFREISGNTRGISVKCFLLRKS